MSLQSVGHLLIAVHFIFGCYYDWNFVKLPAELTKFDESKLNTKKLKYLTYWNVLLQCIFFTICFLNDIIGTNEELPKKKPFIRKIKDIILPTLALPLSMFVALSFWGLYTIDRDLIFPKAFDQFFPSWLNHLMHTNIVIFTVLEMLISYRKYPSRKVGLSVLLAFMLTYLSWIHFIYFYTNMWPYPILNILNFYGRIGFFILTTFITVGLYFVGEKINNLWWRRNIKVD